MKLTERIRHGESSIDPTRAIDSEVVLEDLRQQRLANGVLSAVNFAGAAGGIAMSLALVLGYLPFEFGPTTALFAVLGGIASGVLGGTSLMLLTMRYTAEVRSRKYEDLAENGPK